MENFWVFKFFQKYLNKKDKDLIILHVKFIKILKYNIKISIFKFFIFKICNKIKYNKFLKYWIIHLKDFSNKICDERKFWNHKKYI